MSNDQATARPCEHNRGTNFNWETMAVYDNGQMMCWDCNQIYIPEPLPQTYGSLVNERDALLSEVTRLRDWKESAMNLLRDYDAIAESFGGRLTGEDYARLRRLKAMVKKAGD